MAIHKKSELGSVPEELASPQIASPAPIRRPSKAVSHRRKSSDGSSREISREKRNEYTQPESHSSENFDIPDDSANLDELASAAPVENPHTRPTYHTQFLEGQRSHEHSGQQSAEQAQDVSSSSQNYDIPEDFINLDELASTSPIQNPHERHTYHEAFLEDQRSHVQPHQDDADQDHNGNGPPTGIEKSQNNASRASKLVTEFYTVSYLILFAILGTLARLGLQSLTAFPGSPVTISELWANVSGSVIMGFLSEDRKLFKKRIRIHTGSETEEREDPNGSQETVGTTTETTSDEDAEKGRMENQKAHTAMKKTIPLYIGLATGFCGSFTSFSSSIRDIFLELANQPLAIPLDSTSMSVVRRHGGYSFMATLAVIIITVCLCLSALKVGAHLAIGLEKFTPPLPAFITSKAFDRCVVVFSWGLWLGSVFLAIWPPDQNWRGRVLFAIVLAPIGCILRFYASIRMNGIPPSLPLGTFFVNICGTAILGMCWDLQRAALGAGRTSIGGGRLGCQFLQGVQDGFCGCLTTVSTWLLELMSLRRSHAYVYGGVSVGVGLALLVAIMGSLVWTRGVAPLACSV